MKRFTDDPRKMSPYITDDLKEVVKNNLQTRRIWTDKFVYTRAEINYWYSQQPNRHNIRNYRYRMSSNNTGVLGIDYQEVSKIVSDSDTDWMCFIKEDSDGLTKIGQKLFQLAIKKTNVVLNMAIAPGIILIPSNMIILKEKVAGYLRIPGN